MVGLDKSIEWCSHMISASTSHTQLHYICIESASTHEIQTYANVPNPNQYRWHYNLLNDVYKSSIIAAHNELKIRRRWTCFEVNISRQQMDHISFIITLLLKHHVTTVPPALSKNNRQKNVLNLERHFSRAWLKD